MSVGLTVLLHRVALEPDLAASIALYPAVAMGYSVIGVTYFP